MLFYLWMNMNVYICPMLSSCPCVRANVYMLFGHIINNLLVGPCIYAYMRLVDAIHAVHNKNIPHYIQ